MATCIPIEIPNWVTQDERRSAEIKVFKKCSAELSDDWHIFYSRPWWGLNERGGEKDGEADFILAHPELGILFLEVKGGQIIYDSHRDQWASTDRHGITHNFRKSPVQQAVASKYELMKKFQKSEKWPSKRVLAHYGVVLVDTIDSELKLLGGYEREIFCFSREFERGFLNWIETRLSAHRDKEEIGPGTLGIEAIHEVLATPLKLRTSLSRYSLGGINEMNQLLTGIQLQTLAEIELHNRIVIEGGAGTGKTVIACELASKLGENRKSVALSTVSNSLLSDFRIRLGNDSPNLHIMSIDDLISSEKSFDTIIIDESQDVDWANWMKIEQKLLGPNSKLVCFMDSNQAIYRMATDLENRLSAKLITLRVNLRNTRNIGQVINKLYAGPPTQTCGPNGMKPKLTIINSVEEAVTKISYEIKELNQKEVVDFSSIAILSDNKDFMRKLQQHLKIGLIPHTLAKKRSLNAVTVDNIFNFKGLEAPFVFVFMDFESGKNKELSYVASSRARTYLHVYALSSSSLISRAIQAE